MSWGLNIDALKHYDVVPNKLCRNTTFQHYACTISHMLLMYKAYMANEVRSPGWESLLRSEHRLAAVDALSDPHVVC